MIELPPGSCIGILGGGQLGRMLGVAAAQLGYHVHIYAPEKESVAGEVADQFTCAGYHDFDALNIFAKACDVITFEWENVPVEPLHQIKDHAPLFPPGGALDIAQSRVAEKNFAREQGGRTAPFALANDHGELEAALGESGTPAILKTVRMGYDGKGQARIRGNENLAELWEDMGGQPVIAEGFVEFSHEFSIILVRGQDGEIRYWDTPHNIHENGILAASTVPPPQAILDQQEDARTLASKIAEALNYVGVMTCEFFATKDGPVFNEIAPRVHTSGHWTIEGAVTSQFENHIRAICGLPLGDTGLVADRVKMTNIIGGNVASWLAHLDNPANHLHLYGKSESREGRKMGHVTKLVFD